MDRERSDVTKSVAQGISHRQILDKGVLTNILSVSPDAVEIRPYRALSAGIGTESLGVACAAAQGVGCDKWRFL